MVSISPSSPISPISPISSRSSTSPKSSSSFTFFYSSLSLSSSSSNLCSFNGASGGLIFRLIGGRIEPPPTRIGESFGRVLPPTFIVGSSPIPVITQVFFCAESSCKFGFGSPMCFRNISEESSKSSICWSTKYCFYSSFIFSGVVTRPSEPRVPGLPRPPCFPGWMRSA